MKTMKMIINNGVIDGYDIVIAKTEPQYQKHIYKDKLNILSVPIKISPDLNEIESLNKLSLGPYLYERKKEKDKINGLEDIEKDFKVFIDTLNNLVYFLNNNAF